METDNNCRIHIANAKVKTMFLPGAVRGQDLVNDAGLKQVLQKFDYVAVRPDVQQCKTTEAGDMVWLDSKTLLIGHGYRTNSAGIRQMRDLLGPRGIDVISAPLPYGRGPSSCLHLMSLISLLDEQTALVDLPWLAVETVELLRSRGYRLIEIEYSERDSLACNVLSLGDKRLLALREKNEKTNQKLQDVGFNVRTFPGSELCINGGGGPTCLTRPLKRGENLGGPTRVLV